MTLREYDPDVFGIWKKEDNRAWLWRAYPGGFLGMRGLETIGHWCCRWANGFGVGCFTPAWVNSDRKEILCWPRIVSMPAGARDDEGDLERGDLLPHVNPFLAATWACVLTDLAKACKFGPHIHNLNWAEVVPGTWELMGCDRYRTVAADEVQPVKRFTITFPGADSLEAKIPVALALVMARALVREEDPAPVIHKIKKVN